MRFRIKANPDKIQGGGDHVQALAAPPPPCLHIPPHSPPLPFHQPRQSLEDGPLPSSQGQSGEGLSRLPRSN